MLVGVMLAGFFGVMNGVDLMAVRYVRVMTGFLMVSRRVMLGSRAVMLGGVFVMFSRFQVMFSGMFRRGMFRHGVTSG